MLDWKSSVRATVPRVRIPPSPQNKTTFVVPDEPRPKRVEGFEPQVPTGSTRRGTRCTDGGFAPSRLATQMHEAWPHSEATHVNARFRGAQPAQPASTAENPSLSAAAPSLHDVGRRWHPSLLAALRAAAGRRPPPLSCQSVLALWLRADRGDSHWAPSRGVGLARLATTPRPPAGVHCVVHPLLLAYCSPTARLLLAYCSPTASASGIGGGAFATRKSSSNSNSFPACGAHRRARTAMIHTLTRAPRKLENRVRIRTPLQRVAPTGGGALR